jgi:competence protein ComGC
MKAPAESHPQRGQSLVEMAVVTALVSLALFLLLGSFQLAARSTARAMLLAILLPLP